MRGSFENGRRRDHRSRGFGSPLVAYIREQSIIAASLATLAGAGMASGAVKTFDHLANDSVTVPADYGYLTAANWIGDTNPVSSDDVVFDNSLTTLTAQTVIVGGAATANSWTLGSSNGSPLGAFTINDSSTSVGRTVTLTNGNITVDSSVAGTQSIGTANALLTFASGTGSLNVTNNSTTQTLAMQNTTATNLNLFFTTAGGAITYSTVASPTLASLNGGNVNTTLNRNGTGSARTMTLNGTGAHNFGGVFSTGGFAVNVAGDSTFVQTLSYTGSHAFGGTVTVTSGTLLIDGTFAENGGVTVNGGAIGGSGTINRTAAVNRTFTMAAGSKLTPGDGLNSAGAFSVLWNATSASTVNISAASNDTGAYVFDLGDPAVPTSSDRFVVQTGANTGVPTTGFNVGQLDFADFTFNTLAGFGPGTYKLFDSNSNAGATADQHTLFGTLGNATGTIGSLPATLSFDTANDDVLLTVSAPEPSAVVSVLGLGLVALRRRRRAD